MNKNQKIATIERIENGRFVLSYEREGRVYCTAANSREEALKAFKAMPGYTLFDNTEVFWAKMRAKNEK